MNMPNKTGMMNAIRHGLSNGLRWRLILLWLLALLIPTLLMAIPQWNLLTPFLGYSVHAKTWATEIQVPVIGDLMMALGRDNASPAPNAGFGVILTLLLISPLLNGMLVSQIRHGAPMGFLALLQGGLAEFGRMFRLLLVALIPLGIAAGISGTLMSSASDHADKAVFAADADRMSHVVMAISAFVLLLAHSTVEAGRAHLAVDGRLRSAFKAWWRGLKLLLKRPIATFVVYLLLTVIPLLIAALFAVWRVHVGAAGMGGFLFGLLLTQLVVGIIVWGRVARLSGLARLIDGSVRGS